MYRYRLRLGASASQVTNNNADLNQIMTLVGQLQKQLARQQERRDTDAKAADDAAALAALEDQSGHTEDENLDGEVAEDHELEAQAEAEMLENVESGVSSRRDEEANQAAKEAAKKAANPPQRAVATPTRNSAPAEAVLQKLHSARDLPKATANATAALPSTSGSVVSGPATAPSGAESSAPPAEIAINSSTHKREYMRLVPGLQNDSD